jgi:hypothetical protein
MAGGCNVNLPASPYIIRDPQYRFHIRISGSGVPELTLFPCTPKGQGQALKESLRKGSLDLPSARVAHLYSPTVMPDGLTVLGDPLGILAVRSGQMSVLYLGKAGPFITRNLQWGAHAECMSAAERKAQQDQWDKLVSEGGVL